VVEGYRLGPGDLLQIVITDIGTYVGIRVSNSGKIHVPYVGVMKVNDLTVRQLEAAIGEEMRAQGLLNDPWVNVTVQQPRAHPVYLLGEVMIPGQFLIRRDMRVLDLVTLGGGFNEFAIPVAYLYRRSAVDGSEPVDGSPESASWKEEVIPIDFEKLMRDEDPELNLRLRGGDVLYVPQREQLKFYVLGDVNGAGVFDYPQPLANMKASGYSDRPFRVSDAIGQAGGPAKSAKLSEARIIRLAADGTRQEIPVDLSRILDSGEGNIVIEPDDIVYVPGNNSQAVAGFVLRTMTSILLGGLWW
jgi:polysaccharide export outer membrane protein